MNLEGILRGIKESINTKDKRIVFCDINDERMLEVCKILESDCEKPVLVGKKGDYDMYKDFLQKNDYILDKDYYVIGDGEEEITCSANLLREGFVQGFLGGNISSTGDIVKGLFRGVGMAEGISRVSSYFIQQTDKGLFFTGDCGVQPNPSSHQLAEIAFLTAKSVASYGIIPKIAMLSFSTNGSAITIETKKVKEATEIAKMLLERSDIGEYIIEGEIQLDAALDVNISVKKNPNSQLQGQANVLIFPDLNSGNIGYKLINFFGNATSLGPIIQGLSKSGNDLSRGSTIDEIVQMYYITKHGN